MRFLSIDLGDRRTGLALGDDDTGLATPVGVLEVPSDQEGGRALLEAVRDAIDEQVGSAPCDLVLGLPLNMDGTEGPRAAIVRAFARQLSELTERVVHFHDERLTSHAADGAMARSGLTHGQKKKRRDAIAACEILKSFLAAR